MSDLDLVPSGGGVPAERPEPPHPLQIIQDMVDKGLDVDGIKALSELAIVHDERNARKAFIAALAEFRRRCPTIRKSKSVEITSRSGGTYGYTYAPLDEIARVVDPILDDLGFSYRWSSQTIEGVMTVICHLSHVGGHEETAAFACDSTSSPNPKMSSQQKAGGAMTFARRYSLTAILGLTATDDDDDARGEPQEYERITEQEALDLEAFADEVGADKAGFLRWLGVGSFSDVPQSSHEAALKALARKRDRS